MFLQRTAGNQAVQRLLLPDESSTREPGALRVAGSHLSRSVVQRQAKAPKKRIDQKANISKLTTFKGNADARFTLTSDLSTKALAVGDATKDKLSAVGKVYDDAFKSFRKVLNDAEKEADNQQFWTNTIIGVACGVGASLLAAWVLPSTAAAAFTLTASEAGVVAASGLGQAIAGAAASTGLSKFAEIEGKKIDSGGLDPMILELDMWKRAADIYKSGLVYSEVGKELHKLTVSLGDLVAEARVLDTGAAAKLTDKQVEEKVVQLAAKDAQMAKYEAELTAKLGELDKIKAGVDQIDPQKRSVTDMEKDIWILWMSSLPPGSRVLDLDEIEDRIGPKGLGIVEFGGDWSYTSDAEEDEAIERARDTAKQMEAEATSLPPAGDKGRQLRIITR